MNTDTIPTNSVILAEAMPDLLAPLRGYPTIAPDPCVRCPVRDICTDQPDEFCYLAARSMFEPDHDGRRESYYQAGKYPPYPLT